MPKLLVIPILIITMMSIILASCGGATSNSSLASNNYELTIALGTPPVHPVTVTWENWGKDIEAATNGRVNCKIYNSGSLIPEAQIRSALVLGIADCGNFIPANTPGIFYALEAFELPGNGPSSAVSGSLALWEAYKTIPEAQAEVREIKILWLGSSGSAHIGTVDKPIRSLSDIKGMEIRGSGITLDALESLGATPVSITMPDTYFSLKKKIVSGAVNTFDNIENMNFGELYNYYTICYIFSSYRFYAGMSLRTWNSLPPDLQEIVADVSDGYALKMGQYFDAANDAGYHECLDKNIEIIRLSAAETTLWENSWESIREKWVADMTARGLPGQDLLNQASRLLAKYYQLYPNSICLPKQ